MTEQLPILTFRVVAIDSNSGRPKFAFVNAPSQSDADDFVADVSPNWIVIRTQSN